MNEQTIEDELRPLLTCTFCHDIFADPVKLKLCGHTFCHYCLIKHFRKSKSCSQCNQLLDCTGHKTYTTDLGLQELAYRCFPNETVKAIRRKFDLISTKKAIAYQICSVNLVYLLQHHISSSTGKVRVKVRMNQRRIVNAKTHKDRQTDNNTNEMILRCQHDIPIGSIKKLFAQKFQLSISSLNIFSSNSVCLKDENTISDVVLHSGDFDGITPILLIVHSNEEVIKESLPQIDDDMPVLEAEIYESQSPPPALPMLEPELPSSSKQQQPPSPMLIEEEQQIVPEMPPILASSSSTNVDQKVALKRKLADDEAKPPKIRKIQSNTEIKLPTHQSPSTQQEMMALFNILNPSPSSSSSSSSNKQLNTPSTNPSSSIFAPTVKTPNTPLFNKTPPAFPLMPHEFAAAIYYQMFANNPAMLQRALNGHAPQSMMPNRFPFGQPQFHQQQQQSSQLSPMAMQNLVTETQNNEMWLKCLQMSNQMSAAQRANVKKPGATVKPMRREPNKVSPTTSMDNRTDKKDSIEGCKQEPNASDAEHLHQILTCANI